MSFAEWLKGWLAHHPIKEPPANTGREFTAQVMARVRAEAPAPARQPVLAWPRMVVACAFSVALALFVVAKLSPRPAATTQLASKTPAETAVSAGPSAQPAQAEPAQAPATPVQLAESGEEQGKWLEQTLYLLDELDEDASLDESEEDWLEELKELDQEEFAAASS